MTIQAVILIGGLILFAAFLALAWVGYLLRGYRGDDPLD